MNSLPQDIVTIILRKATEIEYQTANKSIVDCLKTYPYFQTKSFITKKTNLDNLLVTKILDENNQIRKMFKTLYSTNVYIYNDYVNEQM